MTTICAFCLSNDRILTLIDEKYWKIVDFCINNSEEDGEIEYLQCLQRKRALQICWECSTKLQNFHQFISTSQQCVRVLNTYLEASTQILPPTTSKLYRTNLEIIDTIPKYKEIKTEEESQTEDVTNTETEDVADSIHTWPIYEETETEDVTETLDVKMEIDSFETELNEIPDSNNGEAINSDSREDPCTSVDVEMIKEQVVWWRVILHRLPTDILTANIMSSGASVTICDGTNNSQIEPTEDVPRVEALHEVTENISKKDKVHYKTTVFKIPHQIKRVSRCYICDHCQQKINTKMKLQQHISIHYGVSEVNLTCQTCNYKVYSVQGLQKHSRLHDEKRRFKCHSCTYVSRKKPLMLHVQAHMGEKQYKCDLCDYASSSSGDLKKHMRIHTGEKPFKCDFCDYASSRSSNLKRHMRKHTGEKQYKCDLCDYASNQNDNLKRHIKKHTGDKQYKCDLCGYASSSSGDLKRHMRIHTGEKPYKCDLCDYASSQSGDLKRHMRIHTGEKQYKCDLCEYRSSDSGNISKHKKRLHAASSAT